MDTLISIANGYDHAMEIHQLRYFVAVAEHRHFTRAARDLAVAQPSVSKQIRLLEEELGTPLLNRMRGNLTLSPAGEALLPWARRVLADLTSATDEVNELAGLRRGRLSVGATPSLTTAILPAALARFRAEYPGVDVKLQEAGSQDLVRELLDGALDLALVVLPIRHASLVTTPLLREELVVAVPADHELAERKSLALADLKDVPLVMFREGYDLRATTLAACNAAGFQPRFAVEGGEMDGVLRMTEAGLGVAIVPSMVVARGGPLVPIRISKPSLARTIALAHRRDRRPSRAASELIDEVIALVRSREWLASMPAGVAVLPA